MKYLSCGWGTQILSWGGWDVRVFILPPLLLLLVLLLLLQTLPENKRALLEPEISSSWSTLCDDAEYSRAWLWVDTENASVHLAGLSASEEIASNFEGGKKNKGREWQMLGDNRMFWKAGKCCQKYDVKITEWLIGNYQICLSCEAWRGCGWGIFVIWQNTRGFRFCLCCELKIWLKMGTGLVGGKINRNSQTVFPGNCRRPGRWADGNGIGKTI